MTGTGTTRLDPGAVMTVAAPNNVTQTDRTIDNRGTVVWQGSGQLGRWLLQGTAEMLNSGMFIAQIPATNRGEMAGAGKL